MLHKVFDEYTTSPERGIVMPNHLASSLEDTLGDRADYLNKFTGLTVVAFERPGTASLPQLPRFTVEEYVENASRRAVVVQGLLDDLGIERTIFGHDSGGATDALAMAASGNVKVEKVIAIDPAGMKTVPDDIRSIFKWIRAVRGCDKGFDLEEFKDLEPLENIRNKPGVIDLAGPTLKEAKTYRSVYTSNIGRILLKKLSNSGVPVELVIGEHSYASPKDVQEELMNEFDDNSTVNVQIYPRAEHSFVEPYSHFVHVFQKAMQSEEVKTKRAI
jgi:pimeloyl-ACP methyl ester carboxylesterase